VLHTARWKYRMQKSPKIHHLGTIAQLCRAVFATKARIDNRRKMLNSNISPTCPYNMMNFVPLAAEMGSLVWATPANFNGFRVLAPLLHGTLVVGANETATLNRGCHLYSAGRPSLWAMDHILVFFCFLWLSIWRIKLYL